MQRTGAAVGASLLRERLVLARRLWLMVCSLSGRPYIVSSTVRVLLALICPLRCLLRLQVTLAEASSASGVLHGAVPVTAPALLEQVPDFLGLRHQRRDLSLHHLHSPVERFRLVGIATASPLACRRLRPRGPLPWLPGED